MATSVETKEFLANQIKRNKSFGESFTSSRRLKIYEGNVNFMNSKRLLEILRSLLC